MEQYHNRCFKEENAVTDSMNIGKLELVYRIFPCEYHQKKQTQTKDVANHLLVESIIPSDYYDEVLAAVSLKHNISGFQSAQFRVNNLLT